MYDDIYTYVAQDPQHDADAQVEDAVAMTASAVPLTDSALEDAEVIAAQYATTDEEARLIEEEFGHEPTVAVDHQVEPLSVTALRDTTTGQLLVTIKTNITVTYDSGVEGGEIAETLAVVNEATGEIMELRQLGPEDYADVQADGATGDPTTPEAPHQGGIGPFEGDANESATSAQNVPRIPARVGRPGASAPVAMLRPGLNSSQKSNVAAYARRWAKGRNPAFDHYRGEFTQCFGDDSGEMSGDEVIAHPSILP